MINFKSCLYDAFLMVGEEYQDVIEPLVDRCPVCNKDLSGFPPAYRRKHIERCMRSKPKYVYSDRPRGRPSTKKHIRSVLKAMMCLGIFSFFFIVFELIFHFP